MIIIDFLIMQIAEKYGRKKALISLAIPQMVGWILIYFAQNSIYLIISRFTHGFSGGGKKGKGRDFLRKFHTCLIASQDEHFLFAYFLINQTSDLKINCCSIFTEAMHSFAPLCSV